MESESGKGSSASSARGIISRFMHLLSAQGVDGATSVGFFLYLAWVDTTLYGEVMYALAAGSVVMKVIQFGLYYPLVSALGRSERNKAPEILNRVNVIKLALFGPSMVVVAGISLYRGFSAQMGLILFLVSLGFALEALAETFFEDLRVRGLQSREARIRVIASILSYGYGVLTAALGFNPVLISLFKLVSGMVRIGFGIASYCKDYSGGVFLRPQWPAVWYMFRAALVFALIEILGTIYNKTNIFFLESATGVKGVAVYSAAWNLVDPISILASDQFLGWVVFPLLATLWWKNRDGVRRLVRRNAQWLMALAFPIMFFLHVESGLLISLIYPADYGDAVWVQQYLVWTILLSFENNLFAYVMMVAGAANLLLGFAAAATGLNFLLNVTLVRQFGLAGACLVIIFTKLVMTLLTFFYCRIRLRFLKEKDFLFPVVLAGVSLGIFFLIKPLVTLHPAVAITLGFYFVVLWRLGMRYLGRLPSKSASETG
ncbi:MAG: polysaccharide biosynthesis C-terminal domain-containing protein [Desulfomonilaceae bacterium]